MKAFFVAESLVDEVLRTANQQNAKSVNKVKVEVGELSGINTHNLATWFQTLTKGSIAQNTQFLVNRTPGVIRCICGYEGAPHQIFGQGDKLTIECGKCKSTLVTPLHGTDYSIKEISVVKN